MFEAPASSNMLNSAFGPVLLILTTSSIVLWLRIKRGELINMVGGLHVQMWLFFGLGGLLYLVVPDASTAFTLSEVHQYVSVFAWPLALGYLVACASEYKLFRKPIDREPIVLAAETFGSHEFLLVFAVSFLAVVFEGRFGMASLAAVLSYLKNFFYSCVLVACLAVQVRHPRLNKSLLWWLLVVAAVMAVFSPWRSQLLVLLATATVSFAILRKRFRALAAVVTILGVFYLLPFQILKRDNYEEFRRDPVGLIIQSSQTPMGERLNQVLSFGAQRMSFLKEMTYVYAAVADGTLNLSHGESYRNALLQMVPRIFWPGKPELGYNAGFDVPRIIGLLQENDAWTSAAVNAYAEFIYNFPLWNLLWFVPLVFKGAHLWERFQARMFLGESLRAFVSATMFFIALGLVNMVFMASTAIATLVLGRVLEMVVPSLKQPQLAPSLTPEPRQDQRIRRRLEADFRAARQDKPLP